MTITICGSTRFKDQILEVAEGLTLDGHIVMMPTVFRHDDPNLTTEISFAHSEYVIFLAYINEPYALYILSSKSD